MHVRLYPLLQKIAEGALFQAGAGQFWFLLHTGHVVRIFSLKRARGPANPSDLTLARILDRNLRE
jgi:hypothetical protein